MEVGELRDFGGAGIVDRRVGGVEIFEGCQYAETGAANECVVDGEPLQILQRGKRGKSFIGDHRVAKVEVAQPG